MVELIYSNGNVPLIGDSRTGYARLESDQPSSLRLLPVVEPTGLVVGKATRSACHARRLLHPVVHLHIINRTGQVFLQKRSMSKDVYPGLWDCAASGHVEFGEDFQEAMIRETSEEIGQFDYNLIYLDTYLYTVAREKEMVAVYATVGSFDLHPHTDEVDEGKYWNIDDVDSALGTGIFSPAFEADWRRYRDPLQALL